MVLAFIARPIDLFSLGQIFKPILFKKTAFEFTIRKFGSQLDRLFWFSITAKKDEDKLLMLTTKNNKVYINYVSEISEPLGESYIRIIPNFSEYREKDTLTVAITTKYTDVIQHYVEADKKSAIDEKLGVIIPTSEILTVSKFDADIFSRFNSNETEQISEST